MDEKERIYRGREVSYIPKIKSSGSKIPILVPETTIQHVRISHITTERCIPSCVTVNAPLLATVTKFITRITRPHSRRARVTMMRGVLSEAELVLPARVLKTPSMVYIVTVFSTRGGSTEDELTLWKMFSQTNRYANKTTNIYNKRLFDFMNPPLSHSNATNPLRVRVCRITGVGGLSSRGDERQGSVGRNALLSVWITVSGITGVVVACFFAEGAGVTRLRAPRRLQAYPDVAEAVGVTRESAPIALIGRKCHSLRGSEESQDSSGFEGAHVCKVVWCFEDSPSQGEELTLRSRDLWSDTSKPLMKTYIDGSSARHRPIVTLPVGGGQAYEIEHPKCDTTLKFLGLASNFGLFEVKQGHGMKDLNISHPRNCVTISSWVTTCTPDTAVFDMVNMPSDNLTSTKETPAISSAISSEIPSSSSDTDARRIKSCLRGHLEDEHVQQHLNMSLRLHEATHDTVDGMQALVCLVGDQSRDDGVLELMNEIPLPSLSVAAK
ncbi:hypothetical protein KCU65_g11, partial [Aureobasidium melanogenum]